MFEFIHHGLFTCQSILQVRKTMPNENIRLIKKTTSFICLLILSLVYEWLHSKFQYCSNNNEDKQKDY